MDNSKGINFKDAKTRVIFNDDVSEATIIRQQDIDDSHMAWLQDHRMAEQNAKTGDMVLAASIPEAVVDKWFSEGFNIFDQNVNLEAIMKRLRKEDMEHFIATGKRLF